MPLPLKVPAANSKVIQMKRMLGGYSNAVVSGVVVFGLTCFGCHAAAVFTAKGTICTPRWEPSPLEPLKEPVVLQAQTITFHEGSGSDDVQESQEVIDSTSKLHKGVIYYKSRWKY